ncbi:MAG: dipeptidase [Thermomicrobiales bacterium]|nr:dipeptidase [Thermomicrobiales bacterium]
MFVPILPPAEPLRPASANRRLRPRRIPPTEPTPPIVDLVHDTGQRRRPTQQGGSVTTATIPIFDGHNDTLLNLPATGRSFFERSDQGHIDLPRARAGNLVGGFFAVFIPDPEPDPEPMPTATGTASSGEGVAAMANRIADRYSSVETTPPAMDLAYAQRTALAMIARLHRLERESNGQARVVRSVADIRRCLDDGALAMELHMEGAEAIDPDLDALEVYHAAGLRSLGITWSRANRFGHGVPFQFPATPDTGPGLTDLGFALVDACNQLRIMIDLSHLNEAGFWDVANRSNAPLVATHSNVHAISPGARNLTDRQLDAIRDSDGMVGLNFHVGFLTRDGSRDPDIALDIMVDHLDALIDKLGETRVGLGSDFDGATMPRPITDAAGLPRLIDALRARGYDDVLLRKIGYENWLRVLEATWGA